MFNYPTEEGRKRALYLLTGWRWEFIFHRAEFPRYLNQLLKTDIIKIGILSDANRGKEYGLQKHKIGYRDTPVKFRATADEVILYLVENLLVLNSIEECSQLDEYLKRGICIKRMPKNSEGIWSLFKQRNGEVVSSFCTEELIARGYAQKMGCVRRVTIKSPKRAVTEFFYVNKDHLNQWYQSTLINTDKWQLADVKQKITKRINGEEKRLNSDWKFRSDCIIENNYRPVAQILFMTMQGGGILVTQRI